MHGRVYDFQVKERKKTDINPLELLSVTPLDINRSSLIFRKDIGHGKLAEGWLRVDTTSSRIWLTQRGREKEGKGR